MTTVYFYYSFPTNYKNGTGTLVSSATQPCSSDIEYECIKSNKYTNWEIGGASCSYSEKCSGIGTCCSGGCGGGCNATCKSKSLKGISCKGYAGEGRCGCTAGGQQITRSCKYTCFAPPTDLYCYPGAVSSTYISGRKDLSSSAYYVFKATYNVSTFTTPQQVKKLEDNLNENNLGLTSTQIQSNKDQLIILKKKVCATTAANLLLDPCVDYCRVSQQSGQLPSTNCADAWTSFCAYGNNIANTYCEQFCTIGSDGSTNCKGIYHTYCNDPVNFSKPVCRDFYKTQYVNSQLSDPVLSILKTQCAKHGDISGNVIDSTGAVVVPGITVSEDKYPVTTCACFLPDNVYSTFYDKITSSNPSLRNFMTVNQCSYPDCANAAAIQPQKMTCPNVAVTSCIVNNTIGGNVTNSNFNIVNACVTQVETTGTYENKHTNVAPTEAPGVKPSAEEVVAQVPPAAFEFEEKPLPTLPPTKPPTTRNTFIIEISVAAIGLIVLSAFTIAGLFMRPVQQQGSFRRVFRTFFGTLWLVPVVLIGVLAYSIARSTRQLTTQSA